jgi:hypothetical protein
MVVAVAREATVLEGGVSCCRMNPPGVVTVVPIAWLTAAGDWKSTGCDFDHRSACREFGRNYLSHPHSYRVVSADGRGATVRVKRVEMSGEDDCLYFGGTGIYSGAPIAFAAVAADPAGTFTSGPPAERVPESEAEPIRQAFAVAARGKLNPGGEKLDAGANLRVYRVRLEGQDVLVVQRAIHDFTLQQLRQQTGHFQSVFAVGKLEGARFVPVLEMSLNGGNELILGTIHLRNGRDFLITSANYSEGQEFHVLGVRDGKVVVVFAGDGSSC